MDIKNLIMSLIFFLFAAALIPYVNNAAHDALNNTTGVGRIAWILAPFVYSIGILLAILGFLYTSYKK